MRLKKILKRMMVLGACLFLALSAFLPCQVYAGEDGTGTFTSISQLEKACIGVQTGTSFDASIKKKLPDAKVEYFNNKADLMAALTSHKIDAFVVDEPVAQILSREYDGITYLPEYLDTYFFAPVFPRTKKGEALREEFNDFLRKLPEDSLDELTDKWFGADEEEKTMPDLKDLPAKKGTLRLGETGDGSLSPPGTGRRQRTVPCLLPLSPVSRPRLAGKSSL